MPSGKKKKKQFRQSRIILIIAVVLGLVIVAVFYFLPIPTSVKIFPSTETSTAAAPGNCGDLQISVNSVQEATAYYRFGIQKPATDNNKFEILALTVANKGTSAKDFSGFRLNLLTTDGTNYIPTQFNSIEKIISTNNATLDYSCDELALASVSRLTLNPDQSASGCKIYLILNDQQPESLLLYDTSGLKCTVNI